MRFKVCRECHHHRQSLIIKEREREKKNQQASSSSRKISQRCFKFFSLIFSTRVSLIGRWVYFSSSEEGHKHLVVAIDDHIVDVYLSLEWLLRCLYTWEFRIDRVPRSNLWPNLPSSHEKNWLIADVADKFITIVMRNFPFRNDISIKAQ